jgi:phage gp16-like protein
MACKMQQVIKIAQRNLGWDDDMYRDFLFSIVGKRSTTQMSKKELWRVMEELKRRGAPMQSKAKARADARHDSSPKARLIRHLWLTLKSYGVLRDSSEWALLKYVKHVTGCDRLEWCDSKQINLVIEQLKKWVERITLQQAQSRQADG